MQAVIDGDFDKLEGVLKKGWDINQVIDKEGQFNAVTLACHLDKLEVLHFLDMHGADLSQGVGKFESTALMSALNRWNVRIIDYLMERGVDPSITDKFGFTAKRKAEIKQLRTIHSMLVAYEDTYSQVTNKKKIKSSPIITEAWATRFDKFKQNPTDFRQYKVIPKNNDVSNFRPSQLLCHGEYPFSNYQNNAYVLCFFGNFDDFNSNDPKIIV